jgi:DNA transformation protein and related proteins
LGRLIAISLTPEIVSFPRKLPEVEEVMFALIVHETLYFKVDDENRNNFVTAGMGPFVYMGKDKPVKMSYYHLPEEILSDVETLPK